MYKVLTAQLLLLLTLSSYANDTLIKLNNVPGFSTWQYMDDGRNQPFPQWTQLAYPATGWLTGNSEFGYGDGGEVTCIKYGCNGNVCNPTDGCNKYITTYFRKAVTVSSLSGINQFKFDYIRDDGIIVYVNGVEVFRNNMPTGAVDSSTLAAVGVSGVDETTINTFTISGTGPFVAGVNQIAVEVHQVQPTSSDVSFDMRLIALNTSSAALTRGPYLQAGTTDSIIIRWRTDIPTESKVSWGTTVGTYPFSFENPALTTEHIVRIGTLTADTKYYYTIGGNSFTLQSGTDNRFTTVPLTNTNRKLRFVALGDCGNNSANQVNVKNTFVNYMGANDVDAMILLGDNAYSFGTDAEYQTNFFDVYKNDILKFYKLYPAPGNHDYGNSSSNTGSRSMPYHLSFTVPMAGEAGGVPSGVSNYYSFNIGDVHFVSLDSYGMDDANTTKMYDTSGTQATWLKADLAANTRRWTVIYFHHPPYTKTSHTSDNELDLVAIRERFIRIAERYGVDLVLCGHSHGYERSYLLKQYYNTYAAPLYDADFNASLHTATGNIQNGLYNGTANSCAYNYASGQFNHGTIYIVAGSAGQVGSTTPGYPHDAMFYSNAVNGGCLYFEVDSNRLDAKFISYDVAPAPVVRDQFTIFKDVNKVQDITVAQNSTLYLSASWRGSYLWPHNAATTQAVQVSTATIGSMSYIVRDAVGCVKDSFRVNVTTPLANNLISFVAVQRADKVVLNWQVAAGTEAEKYVVEKSGNGINYSPVATQIAVNTATDYTATDINPLIGYNYYRLVKINTNGSREYLGVRFVNYKPTAKIIVTPAGGGSVRLQLQNSLGMESVTVYDALGKLRIRMMLGNNPATVYLTPGLYNIHANRSGYITGFAIH
jgi:acid phosphatase type 7